MRVEGDRPVAAEERGEPRCILVEELVVLAFDSGGAFSVVLPDEAGALVILDRVGRVKCAPAIVEVVI
jgi:hypothetical protein